jgi:hypothetical protein
MNILEDIFSKNLVNLIPDIHQIICTDFIKNNSRNIHKVPNLSCWHECYRHSKHIFNLSILTTLLNTDNASTFREQFAISIATKKERQNFIDTTTNEVRSYSDEEKMEFNLKVVNYVEQFKNESDILFTETYDDVSRDEARDFISEIETQFYFRVIIPCLVLHGKFPSQLLRKARLGNEKFIIQLAQIDYSIVHDKKISKYIHNLSFRNPTRHKLLIRALVRDHPKPKKKDLKIDAAALISLVNSLFCKALKTKKMTAPQIRQLFIDDPDLPVAETFYKSIKRNTMWDDLLKLPDKN